MGKITEKMRKLLENAIFVSFCFCNFSPFFVGADRGRRIFFFGSFGGFRSGGILYPATGGGDPKLGMDFPAQMGVQCGVSCNTRCLPKVHNGFAKCIATSICPETITEIAFKFKRGKNYITAPEIDSGPNPEGPGEAS